MLKLLKKNKIVPFVAAGFVLLVAAWLRFHDLGALPLDNNESGLMRQTVGEVFASQEIQRHPPLYHLMHLIPANFSRDPAAVRTPSAVFGLFSVLLLMLFLGRRTGWAAALAAGTFLALHPLARLVSQTHSTYSMMLLMSLATSMAWLHRHENRGASLGYPALRALGLLTDYLLVFHWAADAANALFSRRSKDFRRDLFRLGVPLLLVAPLALWAIPQGTGTAIEEYLYGPVRESLSDSLVFLLLFFGGTDWPACLVLVAMTIWSFFELVGDRTFRYQVAIFAFSVLGVFAAALVLQVDERHASLYLGAGAWIVGLVVRETWRKGRAGKILVGIYGLLFVLSCMTGETMHDRDDRLTVNTWRDRLDEVARTLPDDRTILAWPALSFNRILNSIEKGRERPEGHNRDCPHSLDVLCRVRGGQMLVFVPGDRSPEPELQFLRSRESFVFLDLYRVFDPGQKLAKFREHPDWPLVENMAWNFDVQGLLAGQGCQKHPDGVVWDCPGQWK